MRFLLLCINLCLFISVFSEILYFNSNKTGMILQEIEPDNIGEYYITEEIDDINGIKTITFYNLETIKKITIEEYSRNFNDLAKISYIDGPKSEIEYYKDKLIYKIENYEDDILLTTTDYFYNSNNELKKIQKFDDNENLLYSEFYYRNLEGSITKIFRTTKQGYYIHKFYKNGTVIESWLTEGNKTTKTEYDLRGIITKIIIFVDEEIYSMEDFNYVNDLIASSKKTTGDIVLEKIYDSKGNITIQKELSKGILIKLKNFFYKDDFLVKEVISGHGKKEEYLYEQDEDGNIISTIQKINDIITRKTTTVGSSEIIEEYNNGILYLKEYFIDGFKTQKELYLKGELFKSESFDE